LSQLPVWRRERAAGENLFKITLASQHAEPFDLRPAHADLHVCQSAQIRRGGQCDITIHSRLQRAFNEYFSHDLELSAGILTDFLGRVSTAGSVLAIDQARFDARRNAVGEYIASLGIEMDVLRLLVLVSRFHDSRI
jgi:hypothetical protein